MAKGVPSVVGGLKGDFGANRTTFCIVGGRIVFKHVSGFTGRRIKKAAGAEERRRLV